MSVKKSSLILSLIILISSICVTAEAKPAYATADNADVPGPYGMRTEQLRNSMDINITSDYSDAVYAASTREVSTSLAYSSYIFTTDDIIFFSYEDGTQVELYDSAGDPVAVEPNVLNKGQHVWVDTSQGVYFVAGSNKFAVLTGDAATSGISGYYAMDADGRGVSREFYTYAPSLFQHCEFIVFAYENSTQVTVQQEVTNGVYADIASFSLNKGEHWANSSLSNKYLHITANRPVSALTCYDQSYFVPSVSGKWNGTEFYTYLSDIAGWPQDLTVIAYYDGTLISVKDGNDPNVAIWSGTLSSGQAHVESYPNGANKYFTITSNKPVTVSAQPWVASIAFYYQGVFIPDRNGTGVGTDIIGSTLNEGYLYVFAHSDNTHIDIYEANDGTWVAGYDVNGGDMVNANPGNGLWRIASDRSLSAYSGYIDELSGFTAEFAPLVFNTLPLTFEKIDDVNDWDCVGPGDIITYTIDYNYPAGPNLPDINDVNIIDYLPDEVEYRSSDPCGTYDSNSHTVTWDIGTLSPGSSGPKTLKVLVKCAPPCGEITNECEMKSGDFLINWVSENTAICCPTFTKLEIVPGGNCVVPGDDIIYHLCYDVNGYHDTNVVITDFLPGGVNYVSSDPCGFYDSENHKIIWGIDFPSDACDCIELVVQVNPTAEPNGVIINTSELVGDCLNLYAEEVTPTCCPEITKADDVNNGECREPNDYINYSIGFNIYGYSDPNLKIIDLLPNDVNYVFSEPAGDYNEFSHSVTWDVSSFAPETNQLTLIVEVEQPKPGGTITNYCQVSSGGEIYDTAYEYSPVCCWSDTIYVDANAIGANYGISWENAFTNLQDAFAQAQYCDCNAIHVAAGTYKPDCNWANPTGSGDQNATFKLINNVAVYGGFPSGGGPWESRNPNVYETILSGDINTPDLNTDNSYHVVTGGDTDETAVLDGFTITGGNGSVFGGGMWNYGGSPTVANCKFSKNFAVGEPSSGGGMYNDTNSSPTVTNCAFIENSAGLGGGMCNNFDSNPTIASCTFSGNSAVWCWGGGGGIYNGYNSIPTVTNCTFTGNSAANGGGMDGGSAVINCIFAGNLAYGAAGCAPTGGAGGGMRAGSNTTVANCIFSGNRAYSEYGGSGGGIYSDYGTTKIANCIIYGNTAWDGNEISGIAEVNYSDVKGDWPGTGNIDSDPCFVELGYWDPNGTPSDANDDFWVDGNYRLLSVSPCIDTGNPNYSDPNNTTDLDGFPRFIDGDCDDSNVVDMGAYEFLHSDIDHNGSVNFKDFAEFALQWLEDDCGLCSGADLTCDNDVGLDDLRKLVEWWLAGVDF